MKALETMRVLAFDAFLDPDVTLYYTARSLGLPFLFVTVGVDEYRRLKWHTMVRMGDVHKVRDADEQYGTLARLIRDFRPDLLSIRSVGVHAKVINDIHKEFSIPYVFHLNENGGSRRWQMEKAKGFRFVVATTPDDVREYEKAGFEKIFYLPYTANVDVFKPTPVEERYLADLGSYGNPVYGGGDLMGIGELKKRAVDILIKPAVDLGYTCGLWGYAGGLGWERGWLDIPFVNKRNPMTRLMRTIPLPGRVKSKIMSSPPMRWGTPYRGAFPWDDLPAVTSGLKIFADIDHKYGHYRTYSPKLVRAMACGTMVLHMKTKGIEEDFRNHEHLVWSESYEETVDLLRHYLHHEEDRLRVARGGMEVVRRAFNSDDHVMRLLREIAGYFRLDFS